MFAITKISDATRQSRYTLSTAPLELLSMLSSPLHGWGLPGLGRHLLSLHRCCFFVASFLYYSMCVIFELHITAQSGSVVLHLISFHRV